MAMTLAALAARIGGHVRGDARLPVRRPCPPDEASRAGDLAIAVRPGQRRALASSAARMAVLVDGTGWSELGLDGVILVSEARPALADITGAFARPPELAPGVHPTAVVHPQAELGAGVALGPFTVVDRGARLADGVCVLGSATIGPDCRVGAGSVLHPGVRIGRDVVIGRRALLHANACIGADGFSFVFPDAERIARAKAGGEAAGQETGREAGAEANRRIHSLAAVRIGDDVEIGAGAAIDRGTLSDTVIGDDVKVDNLVHVGHNVTVGDHTLLCGQVGIAGSARIGRGCVLGGQVGVGDHVRVGDYCLIGGKSMVARQVPARSILVGWAALERTEFHSVFRAIRRLARDRGRPG